MLKCLVYVNVLIYVYKNVLWITCDCEFLSRSNGRWLELYSRDNTFASTWRADKSGKVIYPYRGLQFFIQYVRHNVFTQYRWYMYIMYMSLVFTVWLYTQYRQYNMYIMYFTQYRQYIFMYFFICHWYSLGDISVFSCMGNFMKLYLLLRLDRLYFTQSKMATTKLHISINKYNFMSSDTISVVYVYVISSKVTTSRHKNWHTVKTITNLAWINSVRIQLDICSFFSKWGGVGGGGVGDGFQIMILNCLK